MGISTDLTQSNEDSARKAGVLLSIVRTMVVMGVLALTGALLDPKNDRVVTVIFYLPIFLFLGGFTLLVRRGRVVLAGWIISLAFWVLIAFVTLFFGGLKGENASTFVVAVLMIGVVIGGRAAMGLAIATSAWCALVGWLESTGQLPRQLGAYTVLNAWTALTITLVLTSVLLRGALDSLDRLREGERRAAQARDEALRRSIESQKLEVVGSLAAGVAHDFNNLLMVIAGATSILRDEVHEPAALENIDDLEAATSRATLMTRQLLQFKPATADRVVLSLSQMVRATGAMLPRLLGSEIHLTIEVCPEAWISASPSSVEQILLNLAVNARDAMPKSGTLRIEVRVEGSEVVLAVSDTGVGMDEATKARIFEPFFSTKRSGTGLGLSTVQELVKRFGATITVRSEPGQGTSFEVRFPSREALASLAGTLPAQAAPQPAEGAGHRLLLVEDDMLVRRVNARSLEREGYEVVAVRDGDEALALFAVSQSFSCVVTDCSMARVSGEELAAALADRSPSTPVLLMSGARAPGPEVLTGPRRAFLDKPVDRSVLLAAVRQLIAATG